MTTGRTIAVLWIAWSFFAILLSCVFRTSPSVVALQQAGSKAEAEHVLQQWNVDSQRTKARWNMTLDYGFVATFYPCMALASWVFGRRCWGNEVSATFAGIALLAGLCDGVEDVALEFLWRAPTDVAARIAKVSSLFKFALAPAAFLFVAATGLTLLFRKN